eukprot:COSAG04_NODE_147_length_22902_cov_55.666184_14_plen_99_part_00
MKGLFDGVTIVGLADGYRFVGPVDAAMDAAAMYKTEVEAAGHVFQGSGSPSVRSLKNETLPPQQRLSDLTLYIASESALWSGIPSLLWVSYLWPGAGA